MDRRGHGESVDPGKYSLEKEFKDVVTVVRSMQGQVAVLGHSYGGICAMHAALLSKKISNSSYTSRQFRISTIPPWPMQWRG